VHYVATAKVPGVSEVVGAEQAKASTGKLSPPRAASGINDAQAQEGGRFTHIDQSCVTISCSIDHRAAHTGCDVMVDLGTALVQYRKYNGWRRLNWYILLNIIIIRKTYHQSIDDFMHFLHFISFHSGVGAAEAWSAYVEGVLASSSEKASLPHPPTTAAQHNLCLAIPGAAVTVAGRFFVSPAAAPPAATAL